MQFQAYFYFLIIKSFDTNLWCFFSNRVPFFGMYQVDILFGNCLNGIYLGETCFVRLLTDVALVSDFCIT